MPGRITDIINLILRRIHRPGMIYGVRQNGVSLKDCRISNTTVIEHREKLHLHDNVFIGHFNFIEASNNIEIGEGCQITNYVSIISHSSHRSIRYYGRQYRRFKDHVGYVKGSVCIGAYTFIGPHSIIMPGTNIGKGCIVEAFSSVKGNFEDFSIIGGQPARKIGDTREADEAFLKGHEELLKYYREWAG